LAQRLRFWGRKSRVAGLKVTFQVTASKKIQFPKIFFYFRIVILPTI
jgi:hypothetical protein